MKIAITGASSGLGLAIKNYFNENHEILNISRPMYDFDNLSSLYEIDLAEVDVLIHNAGHGIGGGVGLHNHDFEQCKSIINVNLLAPVLLTQKFINQNNKGKIIFITSRSIEKDIGGDSVYSASKAGLSTFVKCLRDEIKNTDITLTEIRPGRINTNFTKNRGTIKNVDTNRPSLITNEVVDIINCVMCTDFVQTITISRNV